MAKVKKQFVHLGKLKLITNFFSMKIVQILIPIIILGLIIWQGQAEFRRIDWAATLDILQHLDVTRIIMLLALSFIAVASVSGYEFLLRRHFKLPISNWATFRYAWIANTSNNVIGFAGIVGAALRTFLYRRQGISIPTITACIAFLATITITGISLLAWGNIIGLFPIDAVIQSHRWTMYAVWAVALYLPGYLLFQRTPFYSKWLNRNLPQMNLHIIVAGVVVSLVEWLLAGVAFWAIAATLLPDLPLQTALGIYTVAVASGLISMTPGGIGGFDLITLLGLQALGYPPETNAAALVLFRMMYYLIPWLIGLVMGAIEFIRGRYRSQVDV